MRAIFVRSAAAAPERTLKSFYCGVGLSPRPKENPAGEFQNNFRDLKKSYVPELRVMIAKSVCKLDWKRK